VGDKVQSQRTRARGAQLHRYGAAVIRALPLSLGLVLPTIGHAAEITVRLLAPDQYEFTLTSPNTMAERDAQVQIAAVAASVCKDHSPVLGKYHYEAKTVIGLPETSRERGAFRYVQEVSCSPITPDIPTTRRPTLTSESESQRAQDEVVKLSESYFQLIATTRFDQAHAMVSDTGIGANAEKWKSDKQSFQQLAGDIDRIVISKITVYDNPAEAPEPGLYIAADYTNAYSRVPFHCGYLMWFRPVGGTFRITREETGYVTTEQLKAIPSAQHAEILQRLRCSAP
jgi:hypothetical protein